MLDRKIKLILIGDEELVLMHQLSILSYSGDIESTVVCNPNIIEAIIKYAQDENSIVVINLTENGLKELNVLSKFEDRMASIIIIGDQKNVELLSLAIRIGAKDFIGDQDYAERLDGVFCNIKKNKNYVRTENNVKRINAFINAKGGSGASFLASNVAYTLAKEGHVRTALLDLDLQFGAIGLNFDKVAKYSITDALLAIDDLDVISLEGYMAKYNENLSLLLPSSSEVTLPGEINIPALKRLLDVLQASYSQIIVDLPRIIDPISSLIIEKSDQIVLVLQQSLAQFRDGQRLIRILNKDLDIPLDRVVILINRYDPKNNLRISDLQNIINHNKVYTVTNNYARVSSALNLGIPLCESDPNTKIAKDINLITQKLANIKFENSQKTLLGRFKSLFYRNAVTSP